MQKEVERKGKGVVVGVQIFKKKLTQFVQTQEGREGFGVCTWREGEEKGGSVVL